MKTLSYFFFYSVFLLSLSLFNDVLASDKNYQLETLAENLDYPWSISFLPNGDFLLSMRSGELRRLSTLNDGSYKLEEPIHNTPESYVRSQGGYFDVLIDPDFSDNQTIYLAYAFGDSKANATRVVKATLNGNSLARVKPIFTVATMKKGAVHYGGRMVILNDGTIVLTTGDGFQYREISQDPMSQMGKTIRINRDGTVPTDNPFVKGKTADDKVFTLGHRSPQGLAYDCANNIIYLHEHGPQGGDEINILQAGDNYGWPIVTHGVNYSGATISPHQSLEGYIDPIKVWTPSVAPSGLAFYDGDKFPQWKGNLFVGTLVNQDVRRIILAEGKVVAEQIMFTEVGERIRDIKAGPDGLLYILTDASNGRVIRVSPNQ